MNELLPAASCPPSDWCGHYWLRRMQGADTAGADLVAWRLGQDADIGAVLTAALSLPRSLPELAQGFRLGPVDLCAETRTILPPTIMRAASLQEVMQHLLAFQTDAHDPECDGPFRVCLILMPDDVVLALRVERLAGGDDLLRRAVRVMGGQTASAGQVAGLPVLTRPALNWMHRAAGPAPVGEVATARLPRPSEPITDHIIAALRAGLNDLGCPVDCGIAMLPSQSEGHVVLSRAAAEHGDAAPVVIGWLSPDPALPGAASARRLPLQPLADEAAPGIMLGLHYFGDNLELELSCSPDHAPGLAQMLLDRLSAHWQSPPAIAAGPDIAATILQELRAVLGVADMSADDDFFDLGGHSLTATRIVGRLASQHGIRIRFEDIFANPTARKLALCATREQAEPAADPVFETRKDAPLSLAQGSLWKVYAALGKGDIFNIPFALRFLDPVDEAVFGAAFRDLLIRHDILRSLFIEDEGGTVRQRPVPPGQLDDFDWFRPSAQTVGITRGDEAQHIFELSRELPLRLRFLREDDGQVLSLLFHHVVLDEWSVDLMMNDLATAYQARAIGRAPEWADQPVPFADFAHAQAKDGPGDAHLAWWVDRLRDAPPRRPFVAGAGDPGQTGRTDGGWREITVPAHVGAGLHQAARTYGASLFNIVYAAIAAALREVSGQDDLVIGTSAAGRGDPAFFDTVGYFTTVVAHRLRMAADASPRILTEQVRDMINGSLPHDSIPIDLVEEALGHPGPEHMFELFIQIHAGNRMNGTLAGADGARIRYRQIDPDKAESLLGLQFEVVEDVIDGVRDLRVMMSYRTDSYGPPDVDRLEQAVSAMFTRFADPQQAEAAIIRGTRDNRKRNAGAGAGCGLWRAAGVSGR
ncbi:condensation domain-containing protein [Paracoccus sp. (in: a-proteobacteria)]|uniref:condensation domain-containing protein n=1 Tax=Paracoccus sp. TaxID=267 RepID=UPI002AFF0D2C|nr:condensation domain-containing protein [Paracoccus sp. (in: a-proteobacteria)]